MPSDGSVLSPVCIYSHGSRCEPRIAGADEDAGMEARHCWRAEAAWRVGFGR